MPARSGDFKMRSAALGLVWALVGAFYGLLAGPALAQTEATAAAPALAASAQATLEAGAILSKKPPGFMASDQEKAAFWAARLQAAMLLSDGDAAVEALAKLAGSETDPVRRLKIYEDALDSFRKKGKSNQVLKVQDALISDEKLLPGKRALVATRLARSWTLSGDTIRAGRVLDRARSLAKAASPAEVAALEESLPLAIATEELILLSRNGATQKAADQSDVLHAIYWSQFDLAATPEAKKSALGNQARFQWDHVLYLVRANRVGQALSAVREVLAQTLHTRLNAYSEATVHAALSQALAADGAYDAALVEADKAVSVCVAAKESQTSNNCNIARQLRARIMLVLGREKEIQPDLQWIAEGRSRSQVIAGNFNQQDLELLDAAASGDWDKALASATALYQSRAQRWGTDHAYAKDRASLLFLIKLRHPGYALSLADARRFVASVVGNDAADADTSQRGIEYDRAAIEGLLQYILQHGGKVGNEDARELAWSVVEYLRTGVSQSALYDGAAKMAAGDAELRSLIEKEQSLRAALSDRRVAVVRQTSLSEQAAGQAPDAVTLKKQQSALTEAQNAQAAEESKLRQLRAEIFRRFPVYQELTNPHIPGSKELAAKLLPDEAYLSLYSGRRMGAVFVVLPSGQLQLYAVEKTAAETLALVRAMRKPLDLGLVPETPLAWNGFDTRAAADLYQSWIGVARADLGGVRTLHIAPGAALASVPWAATLMGVPKDLASARWLALDKTVVVTPAASSLVLGRSLAAKLAPRPFMAFANPLFARSGGAVAVGKRRNLIASAAPEEGGKGEAADAFDYSTVPALPETSDEARAAARSAGADPDKSVIEGAAATRTRVLAEQLDGTRLLAFATHGIQAGELPRVSKPALAMAYEGRGLADSLLSTDDIVGLRLNAEWVLLSACNTGLVESGSGDSLSGMARAFFAAGAKSVLATQWAVESESAKQLVVNTLGKYAGDPSLGRARALALAQGEMASGKQGELYRHPYFWAAYFLMGEPGGGK